MQVAVIAVKWKKQCMTWHWSDLPPQPKWTKKLPHLQTQTSPLEESYYYWKYYLVLILIFLEPKDAGYWRKATSALGCLKPETRSAAESKLHWLLHLQNQTVRSPSEERQGKHFPPFLKGICFASNSSTLIVCIRNAKLLLWMKFYNRNRPLEILVFNQNSVKIVQTFIFRNRDTDITNLLNSFVVTVFIWVVGEHIQVSSQVWFSSRVSHYINECWNSND